MRRLEAWTSVTRLVITVLGLGAVACTPQSPPPKNLIVISLDTVRADHLPTYGYPRDTAPQLERWAQDAVVFDRAFTQSTQTNPAHASFFTGLYPHSHGNEFNGKTLREGVTTLAEVLGEAGYDTGGFVSGYTLHVKASGLDRGFDHYDDAFEGKRRNGALTLKAAIDWLTGRQAAGTDSPYFLFLHFYDAHGPYLPPAAYRSLFQSEGPPNEVDRLPPYQVVYDEDGEPLWDLNGYVDRYDAMIRYLDDLVGGFLTTVDPETTTVAIISDHGETLDERYRLLDHGGQVFDEQMRMILMLRSAGLAPRRIEAMVEGVDLSPTLLDLLGVDPREGFAPQGRTLAPLLAGTTERGKRAVFSSAFPFSARHEDRGYQLVRERPILAVRTHDRKLISYPGASDDYLELYDLAVDPAEAEDLHRSRPDERDGLSRILDGWYQPSGEALDLDSLDDEVKKQLEALGYLG